MVTGDPVHLFDSIRRFSLPTHPPKRLMFPSLGQLSRSLMAQRCYLDSAECHPVAAPYCLPPASPASSLAVLWMSETGARERGRKPNYWDQLADSAPRSPPDMCSDHHIKCHLPGQPPWMCVTTSHQEEEGGQQEQEGRSLQLFSINLKLRDPC